ncbi:MAG TPA: NAD(P)H-hydrate dehydratase [Candidatus Tumulicola sp.]|jgi:NAD(P)H-hydrate epimerase
MIDVLTPEQMRAADAAAIASAGEDALMRAAGRQIAARLRQMTVPGGRIVAFAGPGNNGGDAFAALAELGTAFERVVHAAPVAHVSQAREAAMERARQTGVVVRPLPDTPAGARAALEDAVAVDGLFGTGTRLPLTDPYGMLARALDARVAPVLAIDVPSGVDALTGAVDGDAVRATATVTVGAAKPGLFLGPARDFVGELWYAPIGIEASVLAARAKTFAALDEDACARLLPVRAPESDKRAAGAPLVIAGSRQFPGAAVLCARAAARAGAGYVTVATPAGAADLLRAQLVEQVVVEMAEDAKPEAVVDALLETAARNSSVAIGPGLGLDPRTGTIVIEFLRRNELPVVIDASALFHLAKHLDVLRGKAAVLTPHAGEFARLSGKGTVPPGQRVTRLREFVERTGITTLLKGRTTLIYDGTTMHLNATGTNALATAGSGDVLTGVTATLAGQGLSVLDAACAGAYWHGRAGQRAAELRPVGVVAGDVVDALASALPHEQSEAYLTATVRRIF